jgi:hypothetical protein
MGCGTLIDADSKTFSTFLLSESMAAAEGRATQKIEKEKFIHS